MPKFIGVGGVSKRVERHYIGVGGVWKEVTGHFVGVAGAWERIKSNAEVALSDANVTASSFAIVPGPTSVTARVYAKNTGVLTLEGTVDADVPGEWLVDGDPADFEARWTLVSGDTPDGITPAAGVWRQMAGPLSYEALVEYTAERSGTSGTTERSGVVRLELRKIGETEVAASADFTITALAELTT